MSEFPWLGPDETFFFPPVSEASPEGIVAVGGNLSPGMLISAYSQGIFPWYSAGEPILWWSPDPRCIFPLSEYRVSSRMRRYILNSGFRVTLDTAFSSVIRACAGVERKGSQGTWITRDMQKAYIAMHELGYTHSVEVWRDDKLVGGLYGMSVGSAFFGESMFSLESNASKVALVHLVSVLKERKYSLLDSQVANPHVLSLGAAEIPRNEYLSRLKVALDHPRRPVSWREESFPAQRLDPVFYPRIIEPVIPDSVYLKKQKA